MQWETGFQDTVLSTPPGNPSVFKGVPWVLLLSKAQMSTIMHFSGDKSVVLQAGNGFKTGILLT